MRPMDTCALRLSLCWSLLTILSLLVASIRRCYMLAEVAWTSLVAKALLRMSWLWLAPTQLAALHHSKQPSICSVA
eukprot:COSAG02_NODE_62344_length_266_cov_0.616766_1_plen_75_part_01